MVYKKADYNRLVIAHLVSIQKEDYTVLRDLQAVGFEAEIRRAAVDGMINKLWDKQMHNWCSAMRLSGITPQQTAGVLSIMATFDDRSKIH